MFVEAHLTVLVLDLTTVKLRNFRRDIDISDEQLYDRCLRHDTVSIEVKLAAVLSSRIRTVQRQSALSLYANVDQSPLSGRGHVTPLDQ